jgi:hypothetical protein
MFSLADVEDFRASADNTHGSESHDLGTVEVLDEFTCDRDTVYVKDKIIQPAELSSSSAVTSDLF